MMPKHSLSARRLTALLAVSLLTLAACDSGGGGGGGAVAQVQILTLPNNQSLVNLAPGTTRQMLFVPTNAAGDWVDKPVTFESSNTAIFTVSASGVVTAVAGGTTAYLRATAGGKTDSVNIRVRYPVQTVNLSPAAGAPALTIRREGAVTLVATTIDTQGDTVTGRNVVFTSGTPATATVNATTGVVTGTLAADGQTTVITATVSNTGEGGVAATANRTITITGDPAVATITLAGFQTNNFYGTGGANFTPTATARSAAGTVIGSAVFNWTSGTPATASIVAGTGEIDILAAGTTVITASTPAFAGGPNVTATRTIEVAPQLAAGANAINVNSGVTASYAVAVTAATDSVKFLMVHTTGDGDVAFFGPPNTTWAWNTSAGPNSGHTLLGGNGFSFSAGGADETLFLTKTALTGVNGGPGFYRLAVHAYTEPGFTPNVAATGTLSIFP